MEQEKLNNFKEMLRERLEELIREAERTISDMTGSEDTFPDPTDRASLEADRNFLLRIRDRERKLILKIQETLDRIESGTFGVCESCGDKIGMKRLEARPVTTLCIECKRAQEEEERMRGL